MNNNDVICHEDLDQNLLVTFHQSNQIAEQQDLDVLQKNDMLYYME